MKILLPTKTGACNSARKAVEMNRLSQLTSIILLCSGVASIAAEHGTYHASQLMLVNLGGVIDIQTWNQAGIGIDIQATTSRRPDIRAELRGSTLRIEDIGQPQPVQSRTNVGSITSIAIGDGSVSSINIGGISAASTEPPVRLAISLPASIPISVNNVYGHLMIGSLRSQLTGSLSGACEVTATTLFGADLNLSGSCEMEITQAYGDMQFIQQGSSELNIHGGKIDRLNLDLHGASSAVIHASVTSAKVSASGAAEAQLREVKERPIIQTSEGASVTID